MSNILLKQIIVVTDGESNIGGDPREAAREAKERGITVSTIGIVGEGSNLSRSEIIDIALNGGGTYDIAAIDYLAQSMTMVTQKSVRMTLQEAVNNELKNIIGKDIKELNPAIRTQVVDYIEKLSDEVDLKCVILMDLSESMGNKLNKAKSSVLELLRSIKAREGNSEICVIGFPGEGGEYTKLISPFTSNMLELERNLKALKSGGNTPTALAIMRAVNIFENGYIIAEHMV